ncbi:MAG: YitT family protein [Oscillospiraceae bacterium]|nr:YitT family protein [Oscillospiraceae bacterium]MBR1685057.1 YitT family protein [Clostridia bacterium]
MNNTKKTKLQRAASFFEMLGGTALIAAAFGLVVVPQGFAAGGVTGLACKLVQVIPVPLSALVLGLNLLLLLTALVLVGPAFAVRTVAVSLLFPSLLAVFSRRAAAVPGQSAILSVLLGGLLLGCGAGLVLRSGASSGGFDIVAVVLNRRLGVPVALVMNLCDVAVIALQAVGQPLKSTLCGVAVICISSLIVNLLVSLDTDRLRRILRAFLPRPVFKQKSL